MRVAQPIYRTTSSDSGRSHKIRSYRELFDAMGERTRVTLGALVLFKKLAHLRLTHAPIMHAPIMHAPTIHAHGHSLGEESRLRGRELVVATHLRPKLVLPVGKAAFRTLLTPARVLHPELAEPRWAEVGVSETIWCSSVDRLRRTRQVRQSWQRCNARLLLMPSRSSFGDPSLPELTEHWVHRRHRRFRFAGKALVTLEALAASTEPAGGDYVSTWGVGPALNCYASLFANAHLADAVGEGALVALQA